MIDTKEKKSSQQKAPYYSSTQPNTSFLNADQQMEVIFEEGSDSDMRKSSYNFDESADQRPPEMFRSTLGSDVTQT